MNKNNKNMFNLKKVLSSPKRFISYCGEHPFATGIFAIISVISFIFSLYSFYVDQHKKKIDTYAIFQYHLKIREEEKNYMDENQHLFCSPSLNNTLKTHQFAQFLFDHSGDFVFIDFEVEDDGACDHYEGEFENVGGIFGSSIFDFSKYRPRWMNLNIGQQYIDKAAEKYSASYAVEGFSAPCDDDFFFCSNRQYVFYIWPPVSEQEAVEVTRGIWGRQFVGLYKVKIPGVEGGVMIHLIPANIVDVEKYNRTLKKFDSFL